MSTATSGAGYSQNRYSYQSPLRYGGRRDASTSDRDRARTSKSFTYSCNVPARNPLAPITNINSSPHKLNSQRSFQSSRAARSSNGCGNAMSKTFSASIASAEGVLKGTRRRTRHQCAKCSKRMLAPSRCNRASGVTYTESSRGAKSLN